MSTTFTTLVKTIWRKYVIDGVPSSGANNPSKDDIIGQLGPQIDSSFDGLQAQIGGLVDLASAQTLSGVKTFSTPPTVPTPVGIEDAANKSYVDGLAASGRVPPLAAVACATTASIALSGEQTIDGVTTSASRVLAKDQATGSQNGTYLTGSGAWTRTTDADSAGEIGLAEVYVSAGTANGGITFQCQQPAASITLGTTALTWAKVAVASTASTADLVAATNTAKVVTPSAAGDTLISSGDRYSDAIPAVSVANGATAVINGNRSLGFNIPSGQTGKGTYINAIVNPSAAELASLVGKTIIMRAVFTASTNFIGTKIPASVYAQAARSDGNHSVGTLIRSEQDGATIIREVAYTVDASDLGFGPTYQVSTTISDTSAGSLQLVGVSWRLQARPTPLASSMADESLYARFNKFAADNRTSPFGLGIGLADASIHNSLHNGGAALNDGSGNPWGLTVPIGSTGYSSLVQPIVPFNAGVFAGRTLRATLTFTTSSNFSRALSLFFQVTGASGDRNNTITIIRNEQVSATQRIVEISAPLTGDETILKPFIQLNDAVTTAVAVETILFTGLNYEIIATTDASKSAQDENLRAWGSRLSAAIAQAVTPSSTNPYSAIVTVKPDGTGNYTTLAAALAAITDASAIKRYLVQVYGGTYTDIDVSTKDWIDIAGVGPEQVWLAGALPDNHTPADIASHSTLVHNSNARLSGLHISAKNMRYPIHSDSAGAKADFSQSLANCVVEHLGNAGAVAYQTGLGGSGNPSAVWGSVYAWGFGSSSGMTVSMDGNTRLVAPDGPFLMHNRVSATRPAIVTLNDTSITATSTGDAMLIRAEGSMQPDEIRMIGCAINGDIIYGGGAWQPTDLAEQPANRAEIKLSGSGNTPAVFTISSSSQALRIDSADTTSASTVAVSGTAAAILFGQQVFTKPGGGGLTGCAYGWANIAEVGVGPNSDQLITSLGQRLGDCSSVSKTLSVSFQGGAAINVVFSTDMRAVSNATILSTINTALSTAGAASAFDVTSRYRPAFHNEERRLKNSSAVGIPMGSVLAYDTIRSQVRLMTSSDAASLYAGVAWEDIVPGAFGRIKTGGYLPITDILRTDSAAFAMGDTFSVTAGNNGKISKGGSQGLLTAIRTDAVKVA